MDQVRVPDALAPTAAPARPLRPLWARALALVSSPRSVFEELEVRPSWFWTAMLLTAVALVLGYIMFKPVIYPYMVEKVESRGLSSEAVARAEAIYESPFVMHSTAFFGALANFALVVVTGLVLLAVCNFLLGGRAKGKQALAVAAHASLVHIPRSLLLLPVMFARHDPTATLGPGVLLPASEAEGFGARALAGLLAGFDLFTLWSLALCVLGMSVVSHLPAKRVGTALVITYLVILAAMSLIGAAFQR